ncbi:MAG: DUF1653 domain-containing protein [Roseburia sp.]|nr:DUF1653 domain-containing protein [Roseburia sp.]
MNTGAERIPKSGELYRHFKNKLYQIVTVAEHTETGEALVIYQALYGDYKMYAESLEMFKSEVDHVKYPAVTQKYRFERVERETLEPSSPKTDAQEAAAISGQRTTGSAAQELDGQGMTGSAAQELGGQRTTGSAAEDGVNPKLLAFFDADTLEEKYNILISMRDEVDDHLINSMAVVLDVVIPEGEVDDRYEQLKSCIRTKQRYETQRLR